ncbi:zygotic DNA replication licensing factor mcm3-like [Tubulanus polymorphus]|uniref:zygotic DNA replication licensing factor mcm3-like n=1 Tax=Tubulanus polymorphus TaxID=672921 RepID=UPI003DA36E34
MDVADIDQRLRDIQRQYLDFLDDEDDQGDYLQRVRDMITNNEVRLVVNINDLRRKNPIRAQELQNQAFEEVLAFQKALKEYVLSTDQVFGKQYDEFFVGFEGSFGAKHVTPRSLTSRFLGNMVCVEGIVTKCSLVRPKVVRSVHYCPATKKTIERKYSDMTSLDAFPSAGAYPTKDEDGNLLETEFGLSIYKDHQTFTIQEMPEKAPAGQLPRSVDIIVDNDLVDKCKPGDRIQCVGTYRCLPGKKNGYTSGTFRTILIANNIKPLSKEVSPMFSADDVAKIKKLSRQKNIDVFEVLAKSLAPSIHGHEYIKKAVLCMLLGGVEKVLENGSRIRGDINVLLIGDPSVAKSQMLRYVLYTAPRAIPTTGRGSSGVGLTAAVTTDQETGERRLEAGAMVLADRGVVCIDEFDKMSDIDRTAIHEVMEQGRVTISKAGIHAKLNARCSVLAAANPVYGRYDQYKTPMENIGLQDSLLSRFDMLFIVLDKMEPDHDRMISDHVLRMHRYRATGEQDGEPLPLSMGLEILSTINQQEQNDDDDTEMSIYEKYNHLLHGGSRKKSDKILSMRFMRKYIHVAKALRPTLTREASDYIAEEYSKLRNMDNQDNNIARTQPVTARALETMIRLSTAHAKSRLSKMVTIDDAQAAVELIHFAYFKRVLEREKKRRHADSDSEEEAEERQEAIKKPKKTKKTKDPKKIRERKPRKEPGEEGYDPYDFETETETEDEENPTLDERRQKRKATASASEAEDEEQPMDSTPTPAVISENRLKQFKTSLLKLFRSEHADSVSLATIQQHLDTFSSSEIDAAIDQMANDNKLMVADNVVFLI